ncbi:hypothetical protein Y598_5699 [Burkholderia pseudomallei MSHR3335]|nr:hypothetical protein Y598_5699 [Burkholderia pseudomallei MSHR3335]
MLEQTAEHWGQSYFSETFNRREWQAHPLSIQRQLKWSSNFGHCSGIGCERFETRWRQSLRSRVKATMVVKID